jgi:hypothetical protein
LNRRTKVIIAISLVLVLVVAVTAVITVSQHKSAIAVGTFLYLWYGDATTGSGGLGSPGWNSSSSPGGGSVVDIPSSGYYVSDSDSTFQTQLGEMQGAGISFAVVSWWGPSSAGESGAINKATLDLFRYLQVAKSGFKVAIMVDAYEGGSNLSASQFAQDYAYISSTFVQPFNGSYFYWQGKPLLLFFNPVYPSEPNDSFTVRSIGNRPNPIQWTFWDAPAEFLNSSAGSGVNAANDEGAPVISSDGEVTLVPRIDSYYDRGYQGGSYLRFDPDLAAGLYAEQWSYVLAHVSQVKLVLIYSWNEYHERSEIEPHADYTDGAAGASYLLGLTAQYVSSLTSTTSGSASSSVQPSFLALVAFDAVILVVLWGSIALIGRNRKSG